MILKRFITGSFDTNNYLLIDEDTKEAVLIDCSEKNEEVEAELKEHGANLKYILLTHGHFDHVLGVNDLKESLEFEEELRTGEASQLKVLYHPDDEDLIANIENVMMSFGMGGASVPETDGFVEDGEEIKVGSMVFKVIHTPGHSKGSVSYLVGDNLFSGDTIFLESVGRTDLYGGDFETLKSSIQEKIFTLPDNVKIYPGHGPETSVGHEKKNNQFI